MRYYQRYLGKLHDGESEQHTFMRIKYLNKPLC